MSEEAPKRKAARIPLSISIRVTALNPKNLSFSENVRTDNVSKIGGFIFTDRSLPVGTVLKIESVNKRFTGEEEVLAEVMSIVTKKKGQGVGIKIIKGQDAWKQLITSL
jgi:hypothetical protein